MPTLFGRTKPSRWNIRGRIEHRQRAQARAEKIQQVRRTAITAAPWAAAATALGAVATWIVRPAGRRAIARTATRATGKARGVMHRIRGVDIADDVIADRVRSSLGRVEKQLDLPRVHVMVHDGMVMLHGAVDDQASAHTIETAVASVAGVRGVESKLHIGLTKADTRPSEGRRMRRLTIGRLSPSRERARTDETVG